MGERGGARGFERVFALLIKCAVTCFLAFDIVTARLASPKPAPVAAPLPVCPGLHLSLLRIPLPPPPQPALYRPPSFPPARPPSAAFLSSLPPSLLPPSFSLPPYPPLTLTSPAGVCGGSRSAAL